MKREDIGFDNLCAYADKRSLSIGEAMRELGIYAPLPAANSVERRTYIAARHRCENPNHSSWKYYGGRGIQFKFKSFREFYECLGPRPIGKSIDRINNDGNYEPGNVRWATAKEQANNQRRRRRG